MELEESDTIEIGKSLKIAGIALGIGLVLILLIFIQYKMISSRQGTIVLPAGDTYLGPSPTPIPQQQEAIQNDTTPEPAPEFNVVDSETWVPVKGNIYPYTFQAPKSLKLVTFDNDAYDIYAIDWNGLAPSSNVLIGVDNLKNDEKKTQYVDAPKRDYVDNWWRQFGGLKGVSSIVPFVNSKGLQGYKAKYFNSAHQTPYLDVFFEIPGKPELVIHLAKGVLSNNVFDKIIDSVSWSGAQTQEASPTPTE